MKKNGGEIDRADVADNNTHTFVFIYQIIQTICLILGGLLYFFLLKNQNQGTNH